jgi:diguanylate cyclase (GGDEF)-like protein
VNRLLVIAGAGIAVLASYMAVLFGVASDSQVGPLKIASIALPGVVTGLAMGGYVLWESRNARTARQRNEELSAQLVRKEIEIGRLATVDELTGLYTRREFDEMIRLELERNRRHGREFALLLLEIDDIAELGENVGKLNKGFLIAEVSAILTHMLRTNDLGCRYTADSLAMLLPETNAHQARVVTEKVRKAIDKHDFLGQVQQGAIKLTVSQGIALAGKHLASHVELEKAAEQALAEARAAGFDQVKIAEAGTAAPEKKSA